MKVVIVFRRNSDHGRMVEEFVHDFKRLHPDANLEVKDLDTREGADAAKLYDVISPPATLALRDDGSMLNMWQGEQMPLMNEVASYLQMG